MNNAKKIISILFITTMILSCRGKNNTDGPVIQVNETEHDYTTIKQYSEGVCIFVISNKGNQTLIINEVKSSCGCTIPTLLNKKINSNDTSIISVKYNTEAIGEFHKTIVVRSNAINANNLILKIKGEVIE